MKTMVPLPSLFLYPQLQNIASPGRGRNDILGFK